MNIIELRLVRRPWKMDFVQIFKEITKKKIRFLFIYI